jgi:Ulp1 family protease
VTHNFYNVVMLVGNLNSNVIMLNLILQIIDHYMNLLKIRDHELAALEDDRRGSGFMDTGLMKHLAAGKVISLDPIQVRKLKGYTLNVDIFNFDLLFIPTNVNNMHWTMIVVKMQSKEIHYYDSMSGDGTTYTNLIKDWLV